VLEGPVRILRRVIARAASISRVKGQEKGGQWCGEGGAAGEERWWARGTFCLATRKRCGVMGGLGVRER